MAQDLDVAVEIELGIIGCRMADPGRWDGVGHGLGTTSGLEINDSAVGLIP